MGKKNIGIESRTGAFSFATDAPLDDRSVIKTKRSLMELDTWGKVEFVFNGLLTIVQETNDAYICIKDASSATSDEKNMFIKKGDNSTISDLDKRINTWWKKLPSQEDLQKALDDNKKELFTFKGVASAIDEDRCTITVSALKIGSTVLTVDKQAYDLGMQTMFHWKGGNYEFWTETSDGTGPRYQATSTSEVNYVKCLDTYYFKTDDEHVWESVNGDKIYESSGNYYTDAAHKNQIAVTTGQHTVYTFEQDTDTLSITYAGSTQTANSGNIGHVYQIGEEEYASNGSIWVQLGSPKEDWIVIK